MKPNNFYMHKDAMDVCIFVDKAFCINPTRYSVRAQCFNLGYCGNPWELNLPRRHEVNPRDWLCITAKVFIPRTKPGLP